MDASQNISANISPIPQAKIDKAKLSQIARAAGWSAFKISSSRVRDMYETFREDYHKLIDATDAPQERDTFNEAYPESRESPIPVSTPNTNHRSTDTAAKPTPDRRRPGGEERVVMPSPAFWNTGIEDMRSPQKRTLKKSMTAGGRNAGAFDKSTDRGVPGHVRSPSHMRTC